MDPGDNRKKLAYIWEDILQRNRVRGCCPELFLIDKQPLYEFCSEKQQLFSLKLSIYSLGVCLSPPNLYVYDSGIARNIFMRGCGHHFIQGELQKHFSFFHFSFTIPVLGCCGVYDTCGVAWPPPSPKQATYTMPLAYGNRPKLTQCNSLYLL